jgi:hypothetical protein
MAICYHCIMSEHPTNPGASQSSLQRSQSLAAELQVRARGEVRDNATGQLYQRFSSLVTEDGKRSLAAQAEERLQQPAMADITRLKREVDEVGRQFADHQIDGKTFSLRSLEIRRSMREKYDSATILQQEELENQVIELQQNRVILTGKEADDAAQALVSSATNADVANQAHLFVSQKVMSPHEVRASDQGHTLAIKPSRPIAVPIGMFINALALESWRGRSAGIYKEDRPSHEVIEEYAAMTSPPPPIDTATAYLLPDGRVLFSGQEAHRTAAAIRRGDQHIEVIRLYVLDESPPEL